MAGGCFDRARLEQGNGNPTLDTIWRLAGQSHSFNAENPHIYRTQDAWATLLVTIVCQKDGETP